MILQAQLDQSQRPPVFMDAPDVPANIGLGNEAIQVPARIANSVSLWAVYQRALVSAQPAFTLALLKRQKFTPEERQERIAASLAALNVPQPTDLTLAQWKEIVEEIEDED